MTYPMDDRADDDTGQMDEGVNLLYPPGLNIDPTPDSQTADGGVDTPDPFSTDEEQQYTAGAGGPVDTGIMYRPPWPITRAPGTVRTIAPGRIIPINPWDPVIALLSGRQLAMLNRQTAARQAAAMYNDDPHAD